MLCCLVVTVFCQETADGTEEESSGSEKGSGSKVKKIEQFMNVALG